MPPNYLEDDYKPLEKVLLVNPPKDVSDNLKTASGSFNSSGDNTVISAVTGKKLKIYFFKLRATTANKVTLIFQDGAGGSELWREAIQTPTAVIGGTNEGVTPPAWLFKTTAGNLLNINSSLAITIDWSIAYWEE